MVLIKDIRPFMKNIDVLAIVIEKMESKATREGHMLHMLVLADSSGCIQCSLFGEDGKYLKEGDIIHIYNGYSNFFGTSLRLFNSRGAVMHRVGEFTMQVNDSFNVSSLKWKVDPFNDREMILDQS